VLKNAKRTIFRPLSRQFGEIPALKSKAKAVFFGFRELIKLSGVNIGKYHFGLVFSSG